MSQPHLKCPAGQGYFKISYAPSSHVFPRARAAGGALCPSPDVNDGFTDCPSTALFVVLPQLCILWVCGGFADSKT